MSWLSGERRLAAILLISVVLAVVGLWTALGLLPRLTVPEDTVTVTLAVEALDWNVTYEAETANRTVLSFLLQAADALGFEVEWTHWESLQAAKVDAINGIRDGQDGLFWQYWVNDKYGEVGADRHILQDGDSLLWRHTTYPPEAGHEA